MERYLLDTSALIRFARGSRPVVSQVQDLLSGGAGLGVCGICVAEFFSGAPAGRYPELEAFLGALTYWDITYDDAVRAGSYRYAFARQGVQLSTQDTLIAAVAARVEATILTDNVKDFPMDDVTLMPLARA